MKSHKKIYLIFVILILILTIFVSSEIKKASETKIKSTSKPIISSEITPISIEKDDPILGNPGAPISIIEFLNIGTCRKECRIEQQKLMQFVKNNPKKVRLIWKDAPSGSFLLSNNNELAHVTAYCAGTQGKFWEFINLITKTNDKINENKLYNSFKELKINESYMKSCLESDISTKKVGDSFIFSNALELKGNLNLFINNKKVNVEKDRDILEILNRLLEN